MTGDASSAGRRALVVSVSHAGGEVKPMSLSAAIDISPELDAGDAVVPINDGPGPLASTVLVQQIKQAGATEKVRRPFFSSFFFPAHILSLPYFSSSLPFVTQLRGHTLVDPTPPHYSACLLF